MAAPVYKTANAKVSLPSVIFECGNKFYVIKSNSNTQAHAERQTILLSSGGILPYEGDIYTWIIVKSGENYELYAKRMFTSMEIFTKHLQLAADLEFSLEKEPEVIYAGEFTITLVESEGPEKRSRTTVELSEMPSHKKTKIIVNLASGSFAPPVDDRSLKKVKDVFQGEFPTKTIEVTPSLESFIPKIESDELIRLGKLGTIDIFDFDTKNEAEEYNRSAINLIKAEIRRDMSVRSGLPIDTSEIDRLTQLSKKPKVVFGGKTKRKRRKRRTIKKISI